MVAPDDVTTFLKIYGKLHLGETECLCLCKQLKVPIFLTDDLGARKEAQRLGSVGSLGIVARAYHLGVISLLEAEKYIMELDETSSLFVTRVIVQRALEQLRN